MTCLRSRVDARLRTNYRGVTMITTPTRLSGGEEGGFVPPGGSEGDD